MKKIDIHHAKTRLSRLVERTAGGGGALRSALKEVHVRDVESRHREGYKRKPVKHGEFSNWESEQVWGD